MILDENVIDVYLLDIKDLDIVESDLKYVSDTRNALMSDTDNNMRKIQHFYTDLLVYYALKQKKAIKKLILSYDEFGKPIYDKDYEISVSHSKTWIAVGISKSSLGIDIQHMDPKYTHLSKRILSKDEQILYQQSIDKTICFYHHWTAKESFFKLKGTGVIKEMSKAVLKDNEISDDIKSSHVDFFVMDNCMLAVAANKKEPVMIKHISPIDVLSKKL